MRGGVYRASTRCLGVVGLVFSVFGGLANLRNSLSSHLQDLQTRFLTLLANNNLVDEWASD